MLPYPGVLARLFLIFFVTFTLSWSSETVRAVESSELLPFGEEHVHQSALNLTDEEIAWIEQHPVVRTAGEMDWAPFDFVNEDGAYDGIAKDYLDLISSRTGLKFEMVTGPAWSALLELFDAKKIDLLPCIYFSEARENKMRFTHRPYYTLRQYYFIRDDRPDINRIEDLYGKKLAVIAGYKVIDVIRAEYPEVTLVEVNNIADGIGALLSGEADAFIESLAPASYAIQQQFIQGIKPSGIAKFAPAKLYMSTQLDNPMLGSILQKALDNIDPAQRTGILRRWTPFAVESAAKKLQLSAAEKAWIRTHPNIRFAGDPNRLPIEGFNGKGRYIGIAADYLKLIEEMTDLHFETIRTKNFDETRALARAGEVDFISEVPESAIRSRMDFTQPYIDNPLVIVMNEKAGYVEDLNQISDRRIAVIDGYGYLPKLFETYPGIRFKRVQNIQEGLQAVSRGNVDAFIGTFLLTSHHIPLMGLSNIKIVGRTNVTTELGFAVRKDFHPLVGILNKALDAVDDGQKKQIYSRWVQQQYVEKVDYTLLWESIGAAALLLMLFGIWNRKIGRMKKEVEVLNASLEAKVAEKTHELQSLVNAFDRNVIASKTDQRGLITYVSDAFCDISGYSREEMLGKTHALVRHPDMPDALFEELWRTIRQNRVWHGEIKNRKKGGGYFWVDITITPECAENGNICSYNAIRHDITDRKAVEELTQNLEKLVSERTEALAESEQKVRNIITTTIQGVWMINAEARTLEVNRAMCGILGRTEDEILGASIFDFVNDANRKIFLDQIRRRKHGETSAYEIGLSRPDGTVVPCIFNATPVLDENGRPKGSFAMVTDISKQKETEEALARTNKKISDSIAYAAMIQGALIPDHLQIHQMVDDYFAIWHPKDVVGGDIYLFQPLRNDNESLLMVIDCTGHGVPGAFVTMLVKAIERQIVARIEQSDAMVSPAEMLSFFNHSIKNLLGQEHRESVSNAGFDGGILYYNRVEEQVVYAGAQTPLFVMRDGELEVIKGNRHSIGYKSSNADYVFTDYTIDIDRETAFYLSTDGFLDQNGGDKGFPYNKKRFQQLIEKNWQEPMTAQRELFLQELEQYQGSHETSDDVTLVAFRVGPRNTVLPESRHTGSAVRGSADETGRTS
jgi:PAS domain S-box-containing protein